MSAEDSSAREVLAEANATFLVQRRILQLQIEQYANVLQVDKYAMKQIPIIPDIIKQRASVEVSRRLLDNFHITLLGILDAKGFISLSSRMQDFIVLMTRAAREEHRAISLHILASAVTKSCGEIFVELGGLRLLKRWIKNAEEEGDVDELKQIVLVCRSLPFVEKIVRETEMGKTIKKLLKYRGSATNKVDPENLQQLHQAINKLIESWTAQLKIAVENKVSTIEELHQSKPLVSSLTKLVEPSKSPAVTKLLNDQPPAKSPRAAAGNPNVGFTAATTTFPENTSTKADSKGKDTKDRVVPPVRAVSESHHGVAAESVSVTGATLPLPTATSDSTSVSTSMSKQMKEMRERRVAAADAAGKSKSDLMAEGAKKLLAASSAASATQAPPPPHSKVVASVSSEEANIHMDLTTDALLKDIMSSAPSGATAKPAIAKPVVSLKSALKRKASEMSVISTSSASETAEVESSSGQTIKKPKAEVKWADQCDGATVPMRQIHLFEVDKIKSSIVNYKNHKDLEKRERQLEKNANVFKIREAMQPTIEWKRPAPLVISMELQESAAGPVESAETDIQRKRLAQVLEARYLDESLIPPDPDEAVSILEDSGGWGSSSTADTISIAWGSSSAPEEEPEIRGGAAFSSSLDLEFADIVNSLPECLRSLDPALLMLLVQDENNIRAILNSDGTVNVAKVALLRMGHLNPVATAPQTADFGKRARAGSRWSSSDTSNVDSSIDRGFDFNRPSYPAGISNPALFSVRSGEGGSGIGPPTLTVPHTRPVNTLESEYAPPPYMRRPMYPGIGDGSRFQDSVGPQQLLGTMSSGVGGSGGVYVSANAHKRSLSPESAQGPGVKPKFPTTKAATPCRFFNTPKGCQFGDKCAFGHFRSEPEPQLSLSRGGAGGGAVGRFNKGAAADSGTRDSFGRDKRF